MTFLSPPAPRPFLLPALPGLPPRVSGPVHAFVNSETRNPLARKLLRTGQFVSAPAAGKPVTPSQLLKESASLLSDGLSQTTAMCLHEFCTEGPTEKEVRSLLVRFNTVLPYSLYDSRARYDRARKGLLGRLLHDLSQAAAPLVPMFTPSTYIESDDFDGYRIDDVVGEVVTRTYPGLENSEYEKIISKMSRRDQARVAARQGVGTYLEFCRVGATLGLRKTFMPEDEVFSAVLSLPDDLRTGAEEARRLTKRLRALHPTAQDQKLNNSDQLQDLDWGHLVYPAFLVIANKHMEHDPLTECLEEQWQMASEYGDTWPQMTLRLSSTSDYCRVGRLLNHTCQALKLVQDALLALGAELC